MIMRIIGAVAAMAALLAAPAAQAEVLPVAGVYPAGSEAALAIDTLAVEPFKGSQGPSLQFKIKERLEGVQIEGADWFVFRESENAEVQAVFKGSASHESIDERVDDKEVTKCIEKDDEGKCLRKRTTYIPCSKLTVRLFPDIRLVAVDGEEIFSFTARQSDSKTYCEDSSNSPSVSGLLSGLHSSVAGRIRNELAPKERRSEYRILERRKGMAKSDRGLFKDAIRMTKNDPLAACIGFQGLEATNSEQASVLFNIGLCKEGEGDLDAAQGYYERTIALLGDKQYTTEAMKRIGQRREANAQLAIRYNAENEAALAEETAGAEQDQPAADAALP